MIMRAVRHALAGGSGTAGAGAALIAALGAFGAVGAAAAAGAASDAVVYPPRWRMHGFAAVPIRHALPPPAPALASDINRTAPGTMAASIDGPLVAAAPVSLATSASGLPESANEGTQRPMAAAIRGASGAGLLMVDFRLPGVDGSPAPGSGSAVSSRKDVRFRGRSLGQIEVAVADGATISIGGPSIAALVAAEPALAERIPGTLPARLTLPQLRKLGLAVRYDPITDAIDLDIAS